MWFEITGEFSSRLTNRVSTDEGKSQAIQRANLLQYGVKTNH